MAPGGCTGWLTPLAPWPSLALRVRLTLCRGSNCPNPPALWVTNARGEPQGPAGAVSHAWPWPGALCGLLLWLCHHQGLCQALGATQTQPPPPGASASMTNKDAHSVPGAVSPQRFKFLSSGTDGEAGSCPGPVRGSGGLNPGLLPPPHPPPTPRLDFFPTTPPVEFSIEAVNSMMLSHPCRCYVWQGSCRGNLGTCGVLHVPFSPELLRPPGKGTHSHIRPGITSLAVPRPLSQHRPVFVAKPPWPCLSPCPDFPIGAPDGISRGLLLAC